jgi:hypothetical protein
MASEKSFYNPTGGNQSPKIKSWGRVINARSECMESSLEAEQLQVEVLHAGLSRGLAAEIYDRQIGPDTITTTSDLVYVRPRSSGYVNLEDHSRVQASSNANVQVRDPEPGHLLCFWLEMSCFAFALKCPDSRMGLLLYFRLHHGSMMHLSPCRECDRPNTTKTSDEYLCSPTNQF